MGQGGENDRVCDLEGAVGGRAREDSRVTSHAHCSVSHRGYLFLFSIFWACQGASGIIETQASALEAWSLHC